MDQPRRRIKNSSTSSTSTSSPIKESSSSRGLLTYFLIALIIALAAFLIHLHYSSYSPPSPSSDQIPDNDNECRLTSEATSALNRAKTVECKSQIRQIACSSPEDLYPSLLPNYCPLKQTGDVENNEEYLGCFKDSFDSRLLTGSYRKYKDYNSPTKCLQQCRSSGYVYAGLQYASECFCGHDLDPKSRKLAENECDMDCLQNPRSKCGGYLTANIYKTGVSPFVPEPVNIEKEEGAPEVKIVYLLTVSGRALRQIYRLIKLIYHRDHYIYIHVDSRNDYLYRELLPLETRFPNIKLARHRFATIWGGASLLKMLLRSMKDLLEIWSDWDFVLNLSESDYPVKPRKALESFLRSNPGRNFVKSHGRDVNVFIKKQGLDRTFHECDNHMWRLGRRQLPDGIQLDGGSDWICLNRRFVTYIINSDDDLITGLKRVFNYTLLPAESFFHTSLRNSEFCWSFVNNNLHLTNWKRKRGCKCQHKAIVDWCGCSPNDILPEEFGKINGTLHRQVYFARKFEPSISQNVLNSVDRELLKVTPDLSGDPTYLKYWQNIYHHKDTPESHKSPLKMLAHSLVPNKKLLLEINSYHVDDQMEGVLLLFESQDIDNEVEEYWVKSRRALNLLESSSLLLETEIGGDFDPKELVFRNYFNVLSQFSQPSLRYRVIKHANRGSEAKVTFYDPTGTLVSSHKLIINETATIESIKVQLNNNKYKIGGVWKATIQFKNERGEIENKNQIEFLVFDVNNDDELNFNDNDPTNLQDYYSVILSCYGKDECANSEWSSLAFDQKSVL